MTHAFALDIGHWTLGIGGSTLPHFRHRSPREPGDYPHQRRWLWNTL
jgi:hypothetical protein